VHLRRAFFLAVVVVAVVMSSMMAIPILGVTVAVEAGASVDVMASGDVAGVTIIVTMVPE
jgi:hypothetical protein